MMQSADNWDKFIDEQLLQFDVVDGVLLITKRGERIYSHGKLSSVTQHHMVQFVQAFGASTKQQEDVLCQKGFDINDENGQDNHFTIYGKTFCSFYSTSPHNNQGLVVCNLPYGVLIASYPANQTSTEAIKVVESACAILRM